MSYDPAISPLGIYPKGIKSVYQRDLCTPIFIVVIVTIAKICSEPRYTLRQE
jgi:hypothetical protein